MYSQRGISIFCFFGVMFLGEGKCPWHVLLVRDFLRGLYLSRSRTGDGQKEMEQICVLVHVLAVIGLRWLRIYISLNFRSGFWACECKLRRKLQCCQTLLSSPVVFITQALLLNSATSWSGRWSAH